MSLGAGAHQRTVKARAGALAYTGYGALPQWGPGTRPLLGLPPPKLTIFRCLKDKLFSSSFYYLSIIIIIIKLISQSMLPGPSFEIGLCYGYLVMSSNRSILIKTVYMSYLFAGFKSDLNLKNIVTKFVQALK